MEENIINQMADEAKSVEEFLGRYRQWPENGRSVARDVARRYLIIRDERDALKALLAEAREGISDLWRDCDKLPHAAYCDPTGFGYCTCYRSGFNAMLHNLHSAIVGNTPPEQVE